MQFPFSFWKVSGPSTSVNLLGDFNYQYLGQPYVWGEATLDLQAEDGLDFVLIGAPFANWYNN